MGFVAAIVAVAVLAAEPAPGETNEHAVCFDPGTSILTASAYARLREVIGEASTMPKQLASITIRAADAGPASLARERIGAITLELMRLGLGMHELATAPAASGGEDCFTVEVEPGTKMVFRETFGHVYFESGSATIDEVQPVLPWVVAIYRPGTTRVLVDGYADTVGDVTDNQELSLQRAEAVARSLARQGVRWSDIEINGHGETRLARSAADEQAEPLNRRAEVQLRSRSPATSR